MSIVDFQSFIDNYSEKDSQWLSLNWNGKFGKKFADQNYLFRQQIAAIVCQQIDSVAIKLVKDLFIELGKEAQLSYVVFQNYHLLAQELLERGGKDYLFSYICAAHISFDTFLSTANIQLSPERTTEMLQYFDYLKENQKDTQMENMFNEKIRERFLSY